MSSQQDNTPVEAEIDEIDPSEMWTPEEREEYFREMDEPPLLMSSFTEEDVKTNKTFQALQSIINDERTNEEMVEDFQHEAKKSFAMGKVMYKKAYEQFKKAIFYCEKMDPTPENKHLLATLYANCALIQMKKENYRTCLKDCNAALALEPRYKKVLYRKAKALAGLNKYKDAVPLCDMILEDDPTNVYTLKLKGECEAHIEKTNKLNEEISRKEQQKEEEKQLALTTMHDRHYQLGPPLYEYPKRFDASIYVKDDELIFPVLLLYPESSQSDYVREMGELDTFTDVFNMLFPSAHNHVEPLEWDEEKQYTAESVELWLEEWMVLPMSDKSGDEDALRRHFRERRWVRVNQHYTLGDVLKYEKYVIPGIPVFYVYANNACKRDFYKAHEDALWQLVDSTTVRPIHRCQHCGKYEKDTEEFKKCSRCKKTFYCSKECQIADWKIHKHICGKKE